MKKIISIFIVLLITILFIPNVNAASVSISNIKLDSKSNDTIELTKPTSSGLNINFDLSFSNVGDFAKYEVEVDNPTNSEYVINTKNNFSNSDYLEYSYEFKDKTNRIKAKSKTTLYITIKYKNEVPDDKLTDGKFVENNTMALNLLGNNNPKTNNNLILLLLILLIAISITIFIKNKKIKNIFIILIALSLVPTSIFALEELKINVVTKVTIEKTYYLKYAYEDLIKESELDNYDLIDDYYYNGPCADDYWEEIDGERYLYCGVNKIVEKHKAGERVQLKDRITINTYDEYDNNFSNETIVFDKDTQDSMCYRYWLYYSKEENKTYKENDPEIMNFNNLENNEWNTNNSNYISFKTPNTFTMPAHDVVFGVMYEPCDL